jgi:outer membrane lipoprotein-sorting protein
MTFGRSIGLIAASFIFVSAAWGAPPTKLDATLAAMDKASASFKSAEADFHKDLYEAIVKQTTPQDGSIYVERKNGATQMGLRITGPGAVIVEYRNGVARRYQPGLKCFETYDVGNKSSTESFLSLGFGGSGKDLAKTWTITDRGTEKIDGKDTEKLDLVAKDANARNNFTHVTLWVDAERGIALKEQFFTPSGDTQTAIYKNIRLNQNIDKKPYAISGNSCGK